MVSTDITEAERIIRTLDYALKTPDAVQIVIALRLGAILATFDVAMACEADRLGVVALP